nr:MULTISPECIES: DUF1566 domain-containing protein [unclassified Allomuricauda]
MKKIGISTILVITMVSCNNKIKNAVTGVTSEKTTAQTEVLDTQTGSSTSKIGQYPLVDTGQTEFFNNSKKIAQPQKGEAFYGQDAQYTGNLPSYTNNGDGTVTDNVTGLMWEKSYEVMTYAEAMERLKSFKLAGYSDWRLPTIKESYSLINFGGTDVSGPDMYVVPDGAVPFIDTDYFDFDYGANGERIIDVQMLSSTFYKGMAMNSDEVVFGVNAADGRIKGYPTSLPNGRVKDFTVRFVRGNQDYGKNNFKDNKDGSISDWATGLMWQKEDSKKGMNWEEALAYAQEKNKENYLGHSDWRLPNAKELQSIVDYNRSPQKTDSPAIDPLFESTKIKIEDGTEGYASYWTSTTHKNIYNVSSAVYVCFGEALGFFAPPHSRKAKVLMDVHGAGAQRSDPKTGNADDYPEGHGPQGDVIRINNYVRLVRDIE